MKSTCPVWLLVFLLVAAAFGLALLASMRVRHVAALKFITANGELLSKGLSEHQKSTGRLPDSLDQLAEDGGAVSAGYLHILTNEFVVVYTPEASRVEDSTVILSLSDHRYRVTVTKDLQYHVIR